MREESQEPRDERREMREELGEVSAKQQASIIRYPVYIHVLPYAKVYLNDSASGADHLIGESPPAVQTKLAPGKHLLTLKSARLPTITKEVEIKAPCEIRINLLEEVAYLSLLITPWAEV